MEEVIRKKINRMLAGNAPRTLDLFAGAGGLSLGFHTAGYDLVAAVEVDSMAAKTHEQNFAPLVGGYSLHRDVTKVTANQLVSHLSDSDQSPTDIFDVVIGGPPCQPFSRVGRAKLREIAGHPEAYAHDPRVTMYARFMALVGELRPLVFMMENVKEIGRFRCRNIPEEIAQEAQELGYVVKYSIVNSAWYGVPQMRERMIIVGFHGDLHAEPVFPQRTHHLMLPKGYSTSRTVNGRPEVLNPTELYVSQIGEIEHPLTAVSAYDAISDLPILQNHLVTTPRKRPRILNEFAAYRTEPTSDYQRLMREWPDFNDVIGVYDHVIRYTPRDYPIFRSMKPGDQYPEAYEIATRLFQERIAELEKERGHSLSESDEEYKLVWKQTVPPYDRNKYPNKWRKMDADKPARTLMAHLGKDAYSHIHYDSSQARGISVREAARLQSFPDGFRFAGNMNSAFKQIGNAVPPLMSLALAQSILAQVRDAVSKLRVPVSIH